MSTALILGAAVWPGGQPSPTLRRRCRHAAGLFRAGQVTRIICCGGLGRHPPAEAEVMAAILRAEGVPEAAIVQEGRSSTTWENIACARALCPDLAETEVVLVSDGYHAPRARLIARAQGLRARADCPAPEGLSRARRLRAALREAAAFVKTFWQIARHR
ncbi:MAG: YdcF family protein [Paracoccaceae bacterium]